jgi:CDP-diacylglycerol--glycerol-3-phosphate 3-phosphatidyltransferase
LRCAPKKRTNPLLRESKFGSRYQKWVEKVPVPFLYHLALRPNHLSITGLFFSLLTIPAYSYSLWLGGIGVLVSGAIDSLDGELARKSKQQTRSGAFLDSILDRYSDFFAVFGIWLYFSFNPINNIQILISALLFLFLTGSFLVSYSRARGEGLGMSVSVGYFGRAERVITLGIGSIITDLLAVIFPSQTWAADHLFFVAILFLLTLGTHFTALQRILFLFTRLDNSPRG